MFPPSAGYDLDIEAISGIFGSISIACWVVVFSPQIIENFKASAADGLSIEFVIIWLLGDVFNILGAVLQGVLPTMIILAIYYTFADIVLLGQCFYYRGFTFRDPVPDKPSDPEEDVPNERTPLVLNDRTETVPRLATAADIEPGLRTRSRSTFRERLASFASMDGTHMSPVVPMHAQPKHVDHIKAVKPSPPRTWTQAILFNSAAIIVVILAGIAGYYLSPAAPAREGPHDETSAEEQRQSLQLNLWGQIFGYICAVLYLGSRIPQLLLNYRRKSTEGLSALFFLFACIGNLTYVLSIFAFEPICSTRQHGHWRRSNCAPGEAAAIYGQHILVNFSWLLGSLGTLFLDMAVFVQFWMYKDSAHAVGMANNDGRGREPDR